MAKETLAEKVVRIVSPFEQEFQFSNNFDADHVFYYKDGFTMQQIIDNFKSENIDCKVDVITPELFSFKCVVNE